MFDTCALRCTFTAQLYIHLCTGMYFELKRVYPQTYSIALHGTVWWPVGNRAVQNVLCSCTRAQMGVIGGVKGAGGVMIQSVPL